ncbi:hypothetical protein [Qipengyuania marisflavi]|uniref:Uncharacterized protein n=1 Tax=Qipengyuania marisflavi TaxID=2486356 RepID=A0A5S3P8H5_9SPHN|nr:hypothetical protein [Qipengyuania marisflavi]TMM49716.1 hypothetical protein FEV51_00460 [Qipengyuania marisflavi]
MARSDPEPRTPGAADQDFGILLGWTADPAGERVALKLQSASKRPDDAEDVREYRYFLSKEQAVLLGNYLYTLAGETAPRRKRPGFFERLFG